MDSSYIPFYQALKNEKIAVKQVSDWHWKVWCQPRACFINYYPSTRSFNHDNCPSLGKGFDKLLSYLKYGVVKSSDKDLIL